MDTIEIADQEVYFRVGVPDPERAHPQRLLVSVEMDLDFGPAANADDLTMTVDYDAIRRSIASLGVGRDWKLLETLAEDIAALILQNAAVQIVRVEIKKFIFRDTRHVAVRIQRTATNHGALPTQSPNT